MRRPGVTAQQESAAPFHSLIVGILVLGLVVWGTSPTLGHFEGALIPWPAHGLAMAILIATPPARRVTVIGLMTVVVVIATAVNAVNLDQAVFRLVPAVALLLAQTIVVALVYDRVSGRTSPVASTTAYAWMLVVVVFGSVPAAAPTFSFTAWIIAAASSGAALVGGGVTLLASPRRADSARPLLSFEFALLTVSFAIAALPFLVWGGLRFGLRGYGVVAAGLVIIVITVNWVDIGPFARLDEPKIDRFRRAWIYLASVVGPAMIFPVALAERGEAEGRARAALAQLRAILASTSDLIAAVDRDLAIVAANPAWIEGWERLAGAPFREGVSRADDSEGSARERALTIEYWRRALAGESFTVVRDLVDSDGAPLELEVTYSSVRDERGEIVGASRVLGDISGRRQREVEKAASRAGDLTQQLLAFARRRDISPKDIDPAVSVHAITRLIAPLIGSHIDLTVRAKEGECLVRVDPTQFEQIVMNLAVNARDAMRG